MLTIVLRLSNNSNNNVIVIQVTFRNWWSGGPGWDFRPLQGKEKVVGLERGPLSLVSTTEELLRRNSSGSGVESREYGRRDSSRWQRGTLSAKKLALSSLTSGGRSVGIVRLRTEATEFLFFTNWYLVEVVKKFYLLGLNAMKSVKINW
jgi:hypothetical protein